MSETENHDVTEAVTETEAVEVDPIVQIYEGQCPSISGRSMLTYAIGRHAQDGTLHLRIVRNSGGGGMFCKDWAEASEIEAIVKGDTELTAKSFHLLHPGKSINTGGFVMAALKELGLIRANEENTRLHEHVPTTTFERQALASIGSESAEPAPKPGRRKGKATD